MWAMCWKLLNEKVKKLTALDISCTKLAVFFATIIIAKLIPGLLKINYWILIVLVIVFAAKPFYDFYLKK